MTSTYGHNSNVNKHLTGIFSRSFWSLWVSAVCALGIALSIFSGAISASPEAARVAIPEQVRGIGYVSLVLGRGYLLNGEKRVVIEPKMSINAGDSIFTESNGHVHIRFIDGALISVRPSSTLNVERYEFDPMRPENSTVKFNLSEGVTRAISGEAARSARSRFRLNTPIAAIGVRGTDFVVRADSKSTRALVNEGAIVMAPFSSLCQSDSLGPCSENAVELAADSFQILELRGTALAPEISPNQPEREMGDLSKRFGLARPRVSSVASESDGSSSAEVYRETVTTSSVAVANDTAEKSNLSGASSRDFTPKSSLTTLEIESDRLVWGRFGSGRGDGELLSVDRASAARGRSITIAASDYLLYRVEPNGARLDSNLGLIGFKLGSAQAFFNGPSKELLLGVDDGQLSVDFVNSTFTTQLDLFHDDVGRFDFRGDGRIADGGYLIGTESDNQNVVGAVSTDGFEAGYFFEQAVQGGSISGLTLWEGR
jgi:hypothetical protein